MPIALPNLSTVLDEAVKHFTASHPKSKTINDESLASLPGGTLITLSLPSSVISTFLSSAADHTVPRHNSQCDPHETVSRRPGPRRRLISH